MLSALPIRSASVATRLVSRPVCAALVGPARSTWVRAAAACEHRVWGHRVWGRPRQGGCSVEPCSVPRAVSVLGRHGRGECAR